MHSTGQECSEIKRHEHFWIQFGRTIVSISAWGLDKSNEIFAGEIWNWKLMPTGFVTWSFPPSAKQKRELVKTQEMSEVNYYCYDLTIIQSFLLLIIFSNFTYTFFKALLIFCHCRALFSSVLFLKIIVTNVILLYCKFEPSQLLFGE